MYTPIFLSTENQLNKVLRKQKKYNHRLSILFVSLWDKESMNLIEGLKRRIATDSMYNKEQSKDLYISNSFVMPHSFVIFKTFKIPALVNLFKDSMRCEDYLPKIYEELGL